MSWLHAAALGAVQGLGEFLPISSSAHLVLLPWLFKWNYQGKAYDVALHLGTLIAVCSYFWKDWAGLIKAGLFRGDPLERRLFWSIILATVPGGLAGLLLDKHVERFFHGPAGIAVTLAAFGVLLGMSDMMGRKDRALPALDWRACLVIGFAQALAVVPGVSRSGITITAGLLLGLKREDAARFSFLLSVPIVAAAGALKLRHLGAEALTGAFWLGMLVTAVSGWLCIRFLLAYLRDRGLGVFVAYRVLLGLFCAAWALR